MKFNPKLIPSFALVGALALVPVSALKEDNIAELRQAIAAQLPASPALFPDGELTDRTVSFRIAEMIREKLTLELNQEVPYGVAVEVERLVEEDHRTVVDAAIWVDREGQKPIVIGAKGDVFEDRLRSRTLVR